MTRRRRTWRLTPLGHLVVDTLAMFVGALAIIFAGWFYINLLYAAFGGGNH